ncbi:MAG TPA: hypothetical protein VIY51_03700 [Xanthobacteraceae bacterium]
MTEAPSPADRLARSEFRVGAALNRAWSVQSRNFLPFFMVTAIAAVPDVLTGSAQSRIALILTAVVTDVIRRLGQAALLYGAFQQMRGRPVSLVRSVQFGLRRFLPVIGLAIAVSLLIGAGLVLLIVPGVIVYTMTFVATPVCVVEELGVSASMERSAQLTKGHRWKILGMALLVVIPGGLVSGLIDVIGESIDVGTVVTSAAQVIWEGIWGAYYAVLAIATYQELRTVKDGVDTEQIAAVFE